MNQKDWTAEDKYRPYDQWDPMYHQELVAKAANSQWRQVFHIQPESGLLNDPNGFSYFDGKWHLFYQAFPFGTIHGLKSWYHMQSDDLIQWESLGEAIRPETKYESHGAYSGSAYPLADELRLFYTGNVRDEHFERHAYQLGATYKNGRITKNQQPLIGDLPAGYTAHFRDPQVFKHQGVYYMLLGAQTTDLQGEILIYRSEDLAHWHLVGPMAFKEQSLGYMMECPHIVGLEKEPILIFCPQGLDKQIIDYDTPHPNTYLLGGHVDLEKGQFEATSNLQNLDDGFDSYATQAMDMPDGRTLAVSWLGTPEYEYPVIRDAWTNCLSLVKELTVKNQQLYQYPVQEINQYKTLVTRGESTSLSEQIVYQPTTNHYELEVVFEANQQATLFLLADEQNSRSLKIDVDTTFGKVTVDRSNVGIEKINETVSVRTSQVAQHQPMRLNIFVDTSSVEIFINQGERVLSLLAFPEPSDTTIYATVGQGTVHYQLSMIGNKCNK